MKKVYDSFLESQLDTSFIIRDKEYVDSDGRYIVEGLNVSEGSPQDSQQDNSEEDSILNLPNRLKILSTIITDKRRSGK